MRGVEEKSFLLLLGSLFCISARNAERSLRSIDATVARGCQPAMFRILRQTEIDDWQMRQVVEDSAVGSQKPEIAVWTYWRKLKISFRIGREPWDPRQPASKPKKTKDCDRGKSGEPRPFETR
jgi:hypothetical protein